MGLKVNISTASVLRIRTPYVSAGQQVQIPGPSAYEVAVANGFLGTEVQWLNSLKGNDGADGLNRSKSFDFTIIIHKTSSGYKWVLSLVDSERGIAVQENIDVVAASSLALISFDFSLFASLAGYKAKYIDFQETPFANNFSSAIGDGPKPRTQFYISNMLPSYAVHANPQPIQDTVAFPFRLLKLYDYTGQSPNAPISYLDIDQGTSWKVTLYGCEYVAP